MYCPAAQVDLHEAQVLSVVLLHSTFRYEPALQDVMHGEQVVSLDALHTRDEKYDAEQTVHCRH